MATAEKTWTQIEDEIQETFRKWRVWKYEIISPFAKMKAVERRKAMRIGQTSEQRQVTIRFEWLDSTTLKARPIQLTMVRKDTALANLESLAKAIEQIRMAEVRGVSNLVMKLYRQMYPEPAKQQVPPPPPPPKEPPLSSGPYGVLHLTNDAPLEIAEAAYRAAIRQHHPDVGGSHEAAKRLNAAIEQIRTAYATRR